MNMYNSGNSPSYAKGCGGGNFMEQKLNQMQSGGSYNVAAFHLFTGCGNDYGTVGLAWVGSLCDYSGYNTGINQIIGSGSGLSTWKVFAHELGHNFGADHSFEEGEGSTG